MSAILFTDYYKTGHHLMYPPKTTKVYSNMTPRKSRLPGVNHVVVWGIQHFVQCLEQEFTRTFFDEDIEDVVEQYTRHVEIDVTHIRALHKLGYLPIEIKSLPEGSLCPIGVPLLTITNTHPDFYWLVNYLETLMSCSLWQGMTSATIAHEYKKLLTKAAIDTGGDLSFVQWQGHDFSMRGMSSLDSAVLSGMGHLTSFTGTDTIPAIYQLEASYGADGLIGASVPATEHAVMSMGTMEDELGTFKRLLELYPKGILSVVSDTWDLWRVLTEHLPKLKEHILEREGKLVIRPDSGDPCDIICGKNTYFSAAGTGQLLPDKAIGDTPEAEWKGVVELLWDVFGGTINEKGYRVLDPHIGVIYGDSITVERAQRITERLKAKKFASTCVVFGIGSYTYQHNTRDTLGFAVKATYGELTHGKSGETSHGAVEAREIYKDPITDDGTKKSAKGLLAVYKENNEYYLVQQCSWDQERSGFLTTVYKDGKLVKEVTLAEVRDRLQNEVNASLAKLEPA